MEEEKEGEREEGGKGAAGKPLDAGGREGKRAAGKPLGARRKEKEREEGGKGAAGKPLPAGRREEGGREIGGSKKNPLHLVRDGTDLLIVGGFGGIT